MPDMTNYLLTCVAVAGLCVGACSKPDNAAPAAPAQAVQAAPSAPAPTAPVAAAADPKDMFKTRCVPCHGDSGHGDGPAAAALNPKPRNYSDAEWQKSVTDEQIKKTIMYGGAAVGKSPIMPASPDLESQPAVLDGLVKIVRGFGQ
jgi:mono/diheme cytochrome c family protein